MTAATYLIRTVTLQGSRPARRRRVAWPASAGLILGALMTWSALGSGAIAPSGAPGAPVPGPAPAPAPLAGNGR